MVQGNLPAVQQFLETSPDADLFLHGVQSSEVIILRDSDGESDEDIPELDSLKTDGVTALHLAATEDFPDMVKLLLSKDVDVNAVDIDGRTPLMKAALWGRWENVDALLKHGADKSLQSVEGNFPRRAADYAKPWPENERRRKHPFYTEDGPARNMDRKYVMFLLGEDRKKPAIPRLDGFTFHQTTGFNTSMSLTTQYSLPRIQKTIARLIRSDGLSEIAAMSGWSHGQSDTIDVAGFDGTQKVLKICEYIGFLLEPSRFDGGIPGRFNACHAEKQLAAYFIHKHLILSSEIQKPGDPVDDILLSRLTLEDLLGTEECERRQREQERKDKAMDYATKLQALQRIWPKVALKDSLILVSREPCHDCQNFIERVNEALRLNIKLLHLMNTI